MIKFPNEDILFIIHNDLEDYLLLRLIDDIDCGGGIRERKGMKWFVLSSIRICMW